MIIKMFKLIILDVLSNLSYISFFFKKKYACLMHLFENVFVNGYIYI